MTQYQVQHQVFKSPQNHDQIHYHVRILYWCSFQLTSLVVPEFQVLQGVLCYSDEAGEKNSFRFTLNAFTFEYIS